MAPPQLVGHGLDSAGEAGEEASGNPLGVSACQARLPGWLCRWAGAQPGVITFQGSGRYAWRVTLLGRLAEVAACQQALSAGREGAAAAVITGAPGIGKTTVWRAAADAQPASTMVLRTTGLQGGQAGLANLADLLNPVTDAVLPRLPPPQAAALRAALGLAAAEAPVTATLLERATVGLLRELAVAGVVVAVDDEQWVDHDSLRLLECAVVRLKDVPVRWLVAVRSGHTGRGLAQMLDHELGAAVARVDLAGLDDAALSELVMDRFPGRWSPGVLRRVVALAAGSPYAALELARETAALGGRDGTAVHLPATLADSLRSRLERLSPDGAGRGAGRAVAETPTRALLRAVAGGRPTGGWMRRWRPACWTRTRRIRCCGSATRCCAKRPRAC